MRTKVLLRERRLGAELVLRELLCQDMLARCSKRKVIITSSIKAVSWYERSYRLLVAPQCSNKRFRWQRSNPP